jgi:hypothetical protein
MMKKFYGIVILILIVQMSFAQKISDPQLIAPENEMENVMPNATLDWNPVSGIGEITYHLQLATDESFSNLVVDEEGIEISAYFNNNLHFGQQYFWRVKASDEESTTEWSVPFSFTVFSKVELKDPKSDDEPLRPLFRWEEEYDGTLIEGVNQFVVEIDTTEDFNSPALISEVVPAVLDKYYTYLSDYLMFGQEYFWRAKPHSSNSDGEFDEVLDFITLVTVELDEPGDGDDEIEFDVVFEWTDLVENDGANNPDLFTYTMELSTNQEFTNPVIYIVDSNSVNSNILKFNTEYFWRVKAAHINDESVYSEVSSFTTVNSMELESPANGAFLTDPRPVLTWTSLAKVDGYQIIFSENEDLSDPTYYLVENGNTETLPLTTQQAGKNYYWSVRAFNGTDTCDWATPYHFYLSATGVNDVGIINDLNVYPSPATDFITMSFNVRQATELSWIITDVLGQNITEETLQVSTGLFSKNISVADLNKGIYFLEITQGDQKKISKFVVK